MHKFTTIKVITPNLKGLSREERQEVINELSKDIAKQIVQMEDAKLVDEEIKYWNKYFLDWEIRDIANEIKYGNKQPE